jgi:hypothetical protein
VVLGERHPLAASEAIHLRDLRGHAFCFFPRHVAPDSYDAVLAALTHTGEVFDVWESPIPQARHDRVRTGEGFTVVPRSLRDRPPAGTVSLDILDDLPSVDLELVWRPDALSPSAGALIAVARRLAVGDSWAASQ